MRDQCGDVTFGFVPEVMSHCCYANVFSAHSVPATLPRGSGEVQWADSGRSPTTVGDQVNLRDTLLSLLRSIDESLFRIALLVPALNNLFFF